jgi:hypothetical protein
MGRGAAALQQASNAEDESSSAHRGDVSGGARLPSNELYGALVAKSFNNALVPSGNADQV